MELANMPSIYNEERISDISGGRLWLRYLHEAHL